MTVALSALTTFAPAAAEAQDEPANVPANVPASVPECTRELVEAKTDCEIIIADTIRTSVGRLEPSAYGQAVDIIRHTDIGFAPIDSVLATVPGVGLFRRADSLSAHPTAQGLSMRGIGANGAGRVLVTLDGVPLNDPFGGWVTWSGIDREGIGEIQVMKGGSAGAYGAQALAGSVELRSRHYHRTGGAASLSYGSFGTFEARARGNMEGEYGALRLSASHMESDGFYLVGASMRGDADVPAALDADRIGVGADIWSDAGTRVSASLNWYRESRVNGIEGAVNDTDALDLSLRLLHEWGDGFDYEVTAYYRTRSFANVFASLSDDRNSASPVLDQYDVPATGAGFLARARFGTIEFGLDGRHADGETNERFRNLGAGFTRDRQAGGQQWTLGGYGEWSHETVDTSLSATARLDRWRSYDGIRTESDIETGALVRQDDVPDRSGWQWSGRLGLKQAITGALDFRAAAYKSWRLPTINEYYRPFRVGNDITEANADLVPERLYGIEAGFDYEPIHALRLSATLYRNWLLDGVGNVTLAEGPGSFPPFGFVPAGGVLRQRSNIDRSITDGLELAGSLKLNNGWSLEAAYLYARARITAFDAMPDLVGKRPVQTPRHSASAGLEYKSWPDWSARLGVRYIGMVYDDDQNSRVLADTFTIDGSLAFQVTDRVQARLEAQNLFDAKVVSALSADGLETLAMRRMVRLGLSAEF